MATFSRRLSDTNPSFRCGLQRTVVKTTTSASRPWYASTEEMATSSNTPGCALHHHAAVCEAQDWQMSSNAWCTCVRVMACRKMQPQSSLAKHDDSCESGYRASRWVTAQILAWITHLASLLSSRTCPAYGVRIAALLTSPLASSAAVTLRVDRGP